MLERRVHDFLRARVSPGEVLLAAVSGGPDSTALLHVLLALRDTLGAAVEVAHLDHGLRGGDSGEDARFVEDLAQRHGLTLHHRSVDVGAERESRGGSLEAVARRIRYEFLHEARTVAGARWILTGHTRDDQAETLLLNLVRGAGPRGLGGMLPWGPGPVCRPFLDTPKTEIEAYLEAGDHDFRTDVTNQDPGPARNRVRHRLVPLLRSEFLPSVDRVLAREARLFAELDDYMLGHADAFLDDLVIAEDARLVELDLNRMADRHPALLRTAVRAVLEDLLGDLREVTFDHVDAVLRLALGPASGTEDLDLPRGVRVRRTYDRMTLSLDPHGRPGSPEPQRLMMTEIGDVTWDRMRLRWRVGPPDPGMQRESTEWFAVSGVGSELLLRSPAPGDRLEPSGMDGSTKLSDLLIDRKVPREERAAVPVLCDNGGPDGSERLLWVVGHRRSRHALAGPDTAQVAYFRAETTE